MWVRSQLKKWAEENFADTKEDIKRIENKMVTKEQFEAIAVSVGDSGRDMVQYLFKQKGHRCVAGRLRVDSDYELDIYCNASALTAVGEAKVRAGGRDVESAFERARELLRRWPDKISGRLVSALYALVAEPSAVQRARELKVWLIENRRELVPLKGFIAPSRCGSLRRPQHCIVSSDKTPLREARRDQIDDASFEPKLAAAPHAERSIGPTRVSSVRRPRCAPS